MEQAQKTILLINDDLDLLEALALALENTGFRVAARLTQGASLRQELKGPPDLIVVDSPLLEKDEHALQHGLKLLLQTQRIPLLLISNQSNTNSLTHKAEATAVLAKPFDFNSFLTAVEQSLEASADLG